MIFLTVGAQLPFDRLVRTVDAWMSNRSPSGRPAVIAQIGRSDFTPRCFASDSFLDPIAYRDALAAADLVVTHAGMGTILSALEFGCPLLVLPRRGDLGETRNDHQFDTAAAMQAAGRIEVAWNEHELPAALDQQHLIPAQAGGRIASYASSELIDAIRSFIHGEEIVAANQKPETPAADPPLNYRFPDVRESARKAA